MRKLDTTSESGLTTVELLVTLFIAALFIGAGYQLYTAISRDSALARQRALASSLAKETMQKHTATATCSTTPSTNPDTVPSDSELPKVSMKTTISAPYGCSAATNIVKVLTTVTYGPSENKQEVNSAILVAK